MQAPSEDDDGWDGCAVPTGDEAAANVRLTAHARTDVEDFAAALLRVTSDQMRAKIWDILRTGGGDESDQADAIMQAILRMANKGKR